MTKTGGVSPDLVYLCEETGWSFATLYRYTSGKRTAVGAGQKKKKNNDNIHGPPSPSPVTAREQEKANGHSYLSVSLFPLPPTRFISVSLFAAALIRSVVPSSDSASVSNLHTSGLGRTETSKNGTIGDVLKQTTDPIPVPHHLSGSTRLILTDCGYSSRRKVYVICRLRVSMQCPVPVTNFA